MIPKTKPLSYPQLVALNNYARKMLEAGADQIRDLTPKQVRDVRRANQKWFRDYLKQPGKSSTGAACRK